MTRRLRLGGGYATVDRDYGGLNAERFIQGQRLFATSIVTLSRDFALSFFFTRALGNDFPVDNRTRFDAVLTYNVLNPLKRGGVLSRSPVLQR